MLAGYFSESSLQRGWRKVWKNCVNAEIDIFVVRIYEINYGILVIIHYFRNSIQI